MFPLPHRRQNKPAFRLRRGVRTTAVDDGLAVIDARGGVLHLNTTARLILSSLLAGGGITTTAAQLAEHSALSESAATEDVTAVVDELTRRHVARWR